MLGRVCFFVRVTPWSKKTSLESGILGYQIPMFHCDDLKREDLNSKQIRLIDLKHQHHRSGS